MARSSRNAGHEEAPAVENWRTRLKRFTVRLGLTLAVVTLLCSWFVILRNYVARLDCYQVDKRTLAPKHLPAWAPPAVHAELAVLPDLPERFSIMSPRICERVAHAFEKNPWVRQVISVRKIYPNRMSVRLRLRRPVAAARRGRSYYLVDADGRCLSPPLATWPPGADALPVIVSSATGAPEKGKIWADDAVRAGASVAATLLRSGDRLRTQFRLIDARYVGRPGGREEGAIVLVTHQGTKVRWGRSPLLVNSPGELTPDEKIAKMELFERKRGPLSSFEYVDVRFKSIPHGRRVHVLGTRAMHH